MASFAAIVAGCRFGGGPALARDRGGEQLKGLSGELGGYLVAAKKPQASDVAAGIGAFVIGGLFETPFERHNPFALEGVDFRYRRSFAGPPQERWFGAAAFMIAGTNYGGDDAGYGGHLQIGRELTYEHASVDFSFRYGLLVEETTIPTTQNVYFHFFHLSVSYGFALRN